MIALKIGHAPIACPWCDLFHLEGCPIDEQLPLVQWETQNTVSAGKPYCQGKPASRKGLVVCIALLGLTLRWFNALLFGRHHAGWRCMQMKQTSRRSVVSLTVGCLATSGCGRTELDQVFDWGAGGASSATRSVIGTGGASTGGAHTGGTSASGGNSTSGKRTGGASATGGTPSAGTRSSSGGTTHAAGGTSGQSSGGTSAAATSGIAASNCIVRVAETGNDANSGNSWTQALRAVQRGLDSASSLISKSVCPTVEVWVAAGTYTPSQLANSNDAGADDARAATFQLIANVGLYGGFAGTESARADRNIAANVTILTGDIGTPGDTTDNSYHVVTGVTGGTLDGFTITGGWANGKVNDGRGAGMYNAASSPVVANCTFTDNGANYGAGMYNEASSPVVTNCTFSNNAANFGYGGGMYNIDSSPALRNCTFTNNGAKYSGGGIYNVSSSPTITNCTFTNNSALDAGGGIHNIESSSPTVTNCTFANNIGGGISNGCAGMYCNLTSSPIVTNCILWGDMSGTSVSEIVDADSFSSSTVSFSIIQGGYAPGANIITADPLFVDTGSGDLHLKSSSPAIDAGKGCMSHVTLADLEGHRRWDIASVPNAIDGLDIGAFEYQGTPGVDTLIGSFGCSSN